MGRQSPGKEHTMISIGYHAGRSNCSNFYPTAVETAAEAQMWLKDNLEWLEENSFGFSIWETNSWYRGPDRRAGKCHVYISWQRDGSECYGQLYDPETGRRFFVGPDGMIREDFVR